MGAAAGAAAEGLRQAEVANLPLIKVLLQLRENTKKAREELARARKGMDDIGGSAEAAAAPVSELTAALEALKSVGINDVRTLSVITDEADKLLQALGAVVELGRQGIIPSGTEGGEEATRIIRAIRESAQDLADSAGGEVVPALERVLFLTKAFADAFEIDALGAVEIFINEGLGALTEAIERAQIEIESLAKELRRVLKNEGVNAALSLGDALVDAALGASIAWDQFLKKLLRDLARAVVKALILRAITAAINASGPAPVSIASSSFDGPPPGFLPEPVTAVPSGVISQPSLQRIVASNAAPVEMNFHFNMEGAVIMGEDEMPAQMARFVRDGLDQARGSGLTRRRTV